MNTEATQSPETFGSSQPTRVGIIGGGLGALTAYVVLRFRGVPAKEIIVFSPNSSPEEPWERLSRFIGLKWLRSESVGHLFPTDSPGLATVEAITSRSLKPIIQSWFNRYHPTIETFIQHVRKVANQTGFYRSLVSAAVGNVERLQDAFAIYDTDGQYLATVQHIVLAIGHGQVAIPEAVQTFRQQFPSDRRVTLPYEPKQYEKKTILVVGGGITAATEWVNILEAGGAVAALSWDGFDTTQPLQVPRKYFSARGLRPYQQQSPEDRLVEFRQATRGTIPAYRPWRKLFRQARRAGRLRLAEGMLTGIEPVAGDKLACAIEFRDGRGTQVVLVDRVVSATGFQPATTHPLLQHLVERYQLETIAGHLQLANDCCLPELSQPGSIFAVIGHAAAFAVPCADSLAGMKLSIRRAARHIVGAEDVSWRGFMRSMNVWRRFVIGGEVI